MFSPVNVILNFIFEITNVHCISSREHAKENSRPFFSLLPSPLSSFLLFLLPPFLVMLINAFLLISHFLFLFLFFVEERNCPVFKSTRRTSRERSVPATQPSVGVPVNSSVLRSFGQNGRGLLYLHLVTPINTTAENHPLSICKQGLCASSPGTVEETVPESGAHGSDDLCADGVRITTDAELGCAFVRFPGGWTAHRLPKGNEGRMSGVGSDQPEKVLRFCERILGNHVIFGVSHET